jgi:hypothetical protein
VFRVRSFVAGLVVAIVLVVTALSLAALPLLPRRAGAGTH